MAGRWAGAQHAHNSPIHSPNADTASQTGYNIANDKTPQRYTYLTPSATGDERNLYGQGKPQAKVTHRLAQRSPVWRCGGYTPRRVALNSMARLITMLPERALRRRPTSARTSWQL